MLELQQAVRSADGHPALCECTLRLLAGQPPEGYGALWLGDPLQGYVQVRIRQGRASAELSVHPAHRGQGRGTALVSHLQEQCQARGVRHLEVWAPGDQPAAERLAARHGFASLRVVDLRRRGLEGLPRATRPAGLRTFEPTRDRAAWLALHRAVQPDPERALTGRCLDLRLSQPWYEPDLFWVLPAEQGLAGYVWAKRDGTGQGELFMLAVAPQARGQGLGRALACWAQQELVVRGVSALTVHVDRANQAGVGLYDGLGYRPERSNRCYGVTW